MEHAPLQLAFEGHCHTAAVRCCCVLPEGLLLTGSLDTTIVVWQEQQQQQQHQQQQQQEAATSACSNGTGTASSSTGECLGCTYTPHKVLRHHNDFVMCLCSSSFPSQFYSGGKGQTLYRVSAHTGAVELKYQGHTAAICSVAENGEKVAAGAWNGEARVWCRDTAELLYVLSQPHAFAVTLCWLPPLLVSGSQSRSLCFWQADGTLLKTVEGAHQDIIRSLVPLAPPSGSSSSSRLVSVSNDRSIKVWDAEGRCLATKEEAHEAFIFHCCVSPSRPGCLYTSGDDGVCCLWSLSLPAGDAAASLSPMQRLQHPATVWQAVELPTGDVATCCEDGRLRVWTADEARALPPEVVAAAKAAMETSRDSAKEQKGQELDLETLPTEADIQKRRGAKDGELVVCRRGDEAIVLGWQQQQQQWNFVGHALNPLANRKTRPRFPGDDFFAAGEYDFVFDVEMGEGGTFKKLPFNWGQNPLVVAEAFAAREGLHKSFLPQIVSFINANAGGSSGVPSAAAGAAAAAAAASRSTRKQKHLPVLQCVSFSKANREGLEKGLLEAQQTLKSSDHQAKLSELDEGYLVAALQKFRSENYLKETLRDSEMHVLMMRLSLFPPRMQLAVLDLWRLFALHPQYSLAVKKTQNNGWDFVLLALNRIKETLAAAQQQQQEQQQLPAGLVVCGLRYAANLFVLPTNRATMLQHATQLLSFAKEQAAALSVQGRASRQAFVGLLLNFAVSSNSLGPHSLSQQDRTQLCRLIVECMRKETDVQLFYQLVVAAGTLLSDSSSRQQLQQERDLLQQLQQQLPPLNERVQPDVSLGEATQEVLNLLG